MSDPARAHDGPEPAATPRAVETREDAIAAVVDELLQRAKPDGGTGPVAFDAPEPVPAPRATANPSTVAIVCASQRKCSRLGLWLERVGFRLQPRPDLDAAIGSFKEDPPIVALVPFHARDRRGRPSLEAIRQALHADAPPVLALCRTRRAARAALEAGATDAVVRPFDPRLLSVRVESIVARLRQEAQIRELRSEIVAARRSAADHARQRRRVETSGPDDLTGLPRRDAFLRALRGALASGASAQRRVAVVILDIDRFRNVNQSIGRARANVVLQEFAQRILRSLGPDRRQSGGGPGFATAMVARLTGDQFAILLSAVPPRFDLDALLQDIRALVTEDYDLPDGDRVHLTASIGVALSPDDSQSAQELIQHAEYATSESTEAGGGAIRFYGNALNPWTERHTTMANLLTGALGRKEMAIHFQPIVEAGTGRILAAEALLRWDSPELGSVSPSEFVPIAEERGLMERIGSWVLEEACGRLRAWIDEGLGPIRIAVNVSIGQLVQDRFSERVQAILKRHRIDPELLELELSERGVLRDDPVVMEQLHELRDLGCRLAIDDFGTGNSAVAYLKRFPLTTLKIDRSFVSGIGVSDEDSGITTAITAMAAQLNLTVVAEGVETIDQRRFLERCECAELQGYLFSPPVDEIRFRQLLEADVPPWARTGS